MTTGILHRAVTPRIEGAELAELARRARAGDIVARNAIVAANIPLVLDYVRRYQPDGLDRNDAIQAGCRGLIRAADLWDPAEGATYATYAYYWIKQYINQARNAEITVHVPTWIREEIRAAEAARITPRHRRRQRPCRDLPACITAARRALAGARHLNDGGDDGPGWGMMTDPTAEDPAVRVCQAEDCDRLAVVVAMLSTTEQALVTAHFGLNGTERRPLNTVADELGVRRSTAYMLLHRALADLRRWLEPREPSDDQTKAGGDR